VERAAGLEPATTGLEGQRYYQLSYARSATGILPHPILDLRAPPNRADRQDVRVGRIQIGFA
jgi:hypothetical protein